MRTEALNSRLNCGGGLEVNKRLEWIIRVWQWQKPDLAVSYHNVTRVYIKQTRIFGRVWLPPLAYASTHKLLQAKMRLWAQCRCAFPSSSRMQANRCTRTCLNPKIRTILFCEMSATFEPFLFLFRLTLLSCKDACLSRVCGMWKWKKREYPKVLVETINGWWFCVAHTIRQCTRTKIVAEMKLKECCLLKLCEYYTYTAQHETE